MKKTISMAVIIGFIVVMGACTDHSVLHSEEKVVPVETIHVYEEVRPQTVSFMGTIQPGKTIRFSFKNGGRIAEIPVKKGDRVHKGDTLALLEKTDLVYAEQLAKAQVDMVQAQYEKAFNGATDEDIEQARLNVVKARDAYEYAHDRLVEVEQLYENGTASKQVYDQAKLERNIRESDLKLAREIETQVKSGARYEEIKALSAQLESARTEYEYRRSLLADLVIKSDLDGVVMEVLSEKGEIIGAGHPVVAMRDEEKNVHVGLPEKDLKNISMDTEVFVEKDGQHFSSEIIRIGEVPDNITGLYNVELTGNDLDGPFGGSVTVHFAFGTQKAFFVPLSAIHTGVEDYVYAVAEGRAIRKAVEIITIDNFEVGVIGLKEGDTLITFGTGRVSTGDLVMEKEENNDTAD